MNTTDTGHEGWQAQHAQALVAENLTLRRERLQLQAQVARLTGELERARVVKPKAKGDPVKRDTKAAIVHRLMDMP